MSTSTILPGGDRQPVLSTNDATRQHRLLRLHAQLMCLAMLLAMILRPILEPEFENHQQATWRMIMHMVLLGGFAGVWFWTRKGGQGTFPRRALFGLHLLAITILCIPDPHDFEQLKHGPSFAFAWLCAIVPMFTLLVRSRPAAHVGVIIYAIAAVPLYAIPHMEDGYPSGRLGVVTGELVIICLVGGMSAICAIVLQRLDESMHAARQQIKEFGSYHLERKLGAGGMGEVWLAKHRLLRRPAAIKLIRNTKAQLPDEREEILERFQREAQATAQLHSAHTVSLYDFGATAEGAFYYVMELLDGIDLDTLVHRFGPVPPERAIHFLQQACISLTEAHNAGLVHRDIKPANIFCCRNGTVVDFIKVLDFGLVMQRPDLEKEDPAVPAERLTAVGMIAGTPEFMAPEQARGEDGLDQRTDIYALGCVAYWLLTGRMLFDYPSPMRTLIAHTKEQPLPPSKHAKYTVPPELDELVLACLEKSPADRPSSADVLARQLAEIPGTRPWTQDLAQRWWMVHLDSKDDKDSSPESEQPEQS